MELQLGARLGCVPLHRPFSVVVSGPRKREVGASTKVAVWYLDRCML